MKCLKAVSNYLQCFLLVIETIGILGCNRGFNNPNDPNNALQPPQALNATAKVNGTIEISWSDNSTIEDGFSIERSINKGPFLGVGIAKKDDNLFVDIPPSVLDGTVYTYRVNAVVGSRKSDFIDTAQIVYMAAPSAFKVSIDVLKNSFQFTWKDNSEEEDGYILEKINNYIDTIPVDTITKSDTSLAIPIDKITGDSIKFGIRAFSRQNSSGYSNFIALKSVLEMQWSNINNLTAAHYVCSSPSGEKLVVGGSPSFSINNAETGQTIKSLDMQQGVFYGFSADSKFMAALDNYKSLKIWDAKLGDLLYEEWNEDPEDFQISPTENRCAIAKYYPEYRSSTGLFPAEEHLRVVDFISNKQIWSINKISPQNRISSLLFSADGSALYCMGYDSLHKIDAKDGTIIYKSKHGKNIYSCLISPNSLNIAGLGYDSTLVIWEAKSGNISISNKLDFKAEGISFITDNSYLLVRRYVDNSNVTFSEIQHYQLLNKTPDWKNKFKYGIRSLSISKDGKYCSFVNNDSSIVLWNITTKQTAATYHFNGWVGNSCFVGPSSTDLFVAAENKATRLKWSWNSMSLF